MNDQQQGGIDVMTESRIGRLATAVIGVLREVRALSGREAAFLIDEFARLRGLAQLLARYRVEGWSELVRIELQDHLRRATQLSPYLLFAVLPGSFLALPLLAWWRDRRRMRRAAAVGGA